LKNIQAIILLLSANFISGVAQGISMIAIPWHFANVIEEGELFGKLFGFLTVISIFWTLYSGTLIDRFDRKKIFLIINAIGAIVLLSIAFHGFYYGSLSTFLVGLVFSATFMIFNIHFPNLYSFAQEISAPKDYGKITSYLEIQHQTGIAIAGGIAALLLVGFSSSQIPFLSETFGLKFAVPKLELHQIFLIDGITYILAFVLIMFIRYTSISNRSIEKGNSYERFVSGLKFLKKHPMLFLFGCVSFSIFISVLVTGFYLMPLYIDNHLNAGVSVYAIFEISFAVGAIFAGFFIRYIVKGLRPPMVVIILSLIGSAVYFISVFNTYLPLFYLMFFIIGLSNAGARIMRATYIFNHVPNEVIGRASSVFAQYHILFRIIFLFGFAVSFFTIERNVVITFAILSGFMFLSGMTLLVYFRKIVRESTTNELVSE